MKKILLLFLLSSFVCRSTSSIVISSPGIERRNIGDRCRFQWTIDGQKMSTYDILNMSTTVPTPLATDHSNLSITTSSSSSSDVRYISLLIWNIRLWDAGNYSLSLTHGTTKTTDAGAMLFVYDDSGGSSVVTYNGTLPLPENGSVALSCSADTASRPASHRPPMHYFWALDDGEGELLTTTTDDSSGGGGGHRPRLRSSSGEILGRYNVSEDGRTLVIEALRFSDQRKYFCWAREEGSLHQTRRSDGLLLQLNHRPVITAWEPPSRKFNADIGQPVTLAFYFAARPAVSAALTWTLTDVNGTVGSVPSLFHQGHPFSNPFTVTFTLASDALYGRYSFEMTNAIGRSSGFFSVLPPGRPDAPSALAVRYKTFRLISVEWKCQWFNGLQQTAMLELRDVQRNEVLDTANRTEWDDGCFNSSRNHLFKEHLQADRDYEISVWSNNSLGASEVIRMTVRTTRRFRLLLSHETISIDGNQAKIGFETRHGNMAALHVTCCAEDTDGCTSQEFQVNDSSSYVIMSTDFAPGAAYLFDFKAFGKAPGGEEYFLGIVKGVRVPEDEDESDRCFLAVVVLGSVLAIASVGLFAFLSVFVFFKIRGNEEGKRQGSTEAADDDNNETELKPRKTKEKTKETTETDEQRQQQQRQTNEQQRRPLPDPKTPRKSQVPPPPRMPPPDADFAQETYEAMDRPEEAKDGGGGDEAGEMYTPLDQPPPTRKQQKRNLYS